jgi:hypothetical protein
VDKKSKDLTHDFFGNAFFKVFTSAPRSAPGISPCCAAASTGSGPGAGAEFKPVRRARSQKLPMPTDQVCAKERLARTVMSDKRDGQWLARLVRRRLLGGRPSRAIYVCASWFWSAYTLGQLFDVRSYYNLDRKRRRPGSDREL